jgi:transposase
VFLDETHVSKQDARRRTGYSLRGQRAFKRVYNWNGERSGISAIAALSIAGVEAARSTSDTFKSEDVLDFLKNDLLPIMSPYPAPRSVLVMDNAPTHTKNSIVNLCQSFGVFVLFLPPYSYDFNPIELVFHCAKSYLKRRWGEAAANVVAAARMEEALHNCVNADICCNLFRHCYIPVSDAQRQWARDQ